MAREDLAGEISAACLVVNGLRGTGESMGDGRSRGVVQLVSCRSVRGRPEDVGITEAQREDGQFNIFK